MFHSLHRPMSLRGGLGFRIRHFDYQNIYQWGSIFFCLPVIIVDPRTMEGGHKENYLK